MPEGEITSESQTKVDTRVLNQSARFIRRIRQALSFYKDARELLDEGRFSEKQMVQSQAIVTTSTWGYTFVRMKPDYLDLQIQRRRLDPKAALQEEKIRIVYGESPLYEYSKISAGQHPEMASSLDDEVLARRKVRRFIEDIEAHF